jgi:hypothetical protein
MTSFSATTTYPYQLPIYRDAVAFVPPGSAHGGASTSALEKEIQMLLKALERGGPGTARALDQVLAKLAQLIEVGKAGTLETVRGILVRTSTLVGSEAFKQGLLRTSIAVGRRIVPIAIGAGIGAELGRRTDLSKWGITWNPNGYFNFNGRLPWGSTSTPAPTASPPVRPTAPTTTAPVTTTQTDLTPAPAATGLQLSALQINLLRKVDANAQKYYDARLEIVSLRNQIITLSQEFQRLDSAYLQLIGAGAAQKSLDAALKMRNSVFQKIDTKLASFNTAVCTLNIAQKKYVQVMQQVATDVPNFMAYATGRLESISILAKVHNQATELMNSWAAWVTGVMRLPEFRRKDDAQSVIVPGSLKPSLETPTKPRLNPSPPPPSPARSVGFTREQATLFIAYGKKIESAKALNVEVTLLSKKADAQTANLRWLLLEFNKELGEFRAGRVSNKVRLNALLAKITEVLGTSVAKDTSVLGGAYNRMREVTTSQIGFANEMKGLLARLPADTPREPFNTLVDQINTTQEKLKNLKKVYESLAIAVQTCNRTTQNLPGPSEPSNVPRLPAIQEPVALPGSNLNLASRAAAYLRGEISYEEATAGLSAEQRAKLDSMIFFMATQGSSGGRYSPAIDAEATARSVNAFSEANNGNLGTDISMTRQLTFAIKKRIAELRSEGIADSAGRMKVLLKALANLKLWKEQILSQPARIDAALEQFVAKNMLSDEKLRLSMVKYFTDLAQAQNITPSQRNALQKVVALLSATSVAANQSMGSTEVYFSEAFDKKYRSSLASKLKRLFGYESISITTNGKANAQADGAIYPQIPTLTVGQVKALFSFGLKNTTIEVTLVPPTTMTRTETFVVKVKSVPINSVGKTAHTFTAEFICEVNPKGSIVKLGQLGLRSDSSGVGLPASINLMQQLRSIGIFQFSIVAERSGQTGSNSVGYRVWPLIGFDGNMRNQDVWGLTEFLHANPAISRKLGVRAEEINESTKVSAILFSKIDGKLVPEMAEWWKKNGRTFTAEFNWKDPKSVSRLEKFSNQFGVPFAR